MSCKRRKTNINDESNCRLRTQGMIDCNPVGTRLSYMMTLPQMLVQCFNTRDMSSLRCIISNAFLPDCQLKTSSFPNDVTGSNRIFEFFQNYAIACPDAIMIQSLPQFNIRVVSCISQECGTRHSNLLSDDLLFAYFKHDKSNQDSSYLQEKCKYMELRSHGIPVPFSSVSYVNFILNKEMTHVEKYIHTIKEVQVYTPNVSFL